jgi:hypothetical protein
MKHQIKKKISVTYKKKIMSRVYNTYTRDAKKKTEWTRDEMNQLCSS